jgi:hypothetical protein
MTARVRLDPEVLELLADEPELLALADAFVETQKPRHRIRPVGLVAGVAAVAAVVALVFALAPSGKSHGVSVDTAVAAVGGEVRFVQLRLDQSTPKVTFAYDRLQHRLTVRGDARTLRISAAQLPTSGARLTRDFGASALPAASFLAEYSARARSGSLRPISTPPGQSPTLEWVSYDSSLGSTIEVGLQPGSLSPRVLLTRGSTALRIGSFSFGNKLSTRS